MIIVLTLALEQFMNHNDYMKQIGENYKNHTLVKLGLDDCFSFSCNGCGKCCYNRNDILLNPMDIFCISKYLNKKPIEIVEKYCEYYVGKNSMIPLFVVRFKDRSIGGAHSTVCPFLRKNGQKLLCEIHPFKPFVCAAYPLGRISSADGAIDYFLQDVNCGELNAKQHTVRDWIGRFSEQEQTDYMDTFVKFMSMYNKFIQKKLFKQLNNQEKSRFFNIVAYELYFHFDHKQNFLNQFKENTKTLNRIFSNNGDLC